MSFEIRPLTAALGAEIHGIDLTSLDDDAFAELRKLWLDYKVLFFRDQDLTIEEHIAFGRRFGELELHPFAPDLPEFPEIVHITSTKERPYAANSWHSDVTWRRAPSLGSILRGRVIPPVGGDTCFANAVMAYERLRPEWKERIEGLTAEHDYMRVFGRGVPDDKKDEMRKKYPVQHHPVVRTHPETGEKAIYTNRNFVNHIDGIAPEESEEILEHLERSIMSPNVQCRFRWEKDSVAMWDNRSTQHFATNDFWPEERRMERVTIVGDVPR
ncbi:MAG: taurine dioxygenase [Deltaproteobacteria bacterium]|nr:taurine dioxygenase [Deltaproteobacteria bacterium]